MTQAYQNVLAAVRAYVASPDTEDVIEPSGASGRIYNELAGQLSVSRVQDSWRERNEWNGFTSQALRALNRLAEEGTLIKVSRGKPGPEGHTLGGTRFYTPDAFAAAERRAQEKRKADTELAGAWLALAGRLSSLGITAEVNRQRGLMLDLDGWESLVTLAEGPVALP
jgi:hypothetical protein